MLIQINYGSQRIVVEFAQYLAMLTACERSGLVTTKRYNKLPSVN